MDGQEQTRRAPFIFSVWRVWQRHYYCAVVVP